MKMVEGGQWNIQTQSTWSVSMTRMVKGGHGHWGYNGNYWKCIWWLCWSKNELTFYPSERYFWVDDFPFPFWWDMWSFPGGYILLFDGLSHYSSDVFSKCIQKVVLMLDFRTIGPCSHHGRLLLTPWVLYQRFLLKTDIMGPAMKG